MSVAGRPQCALHAPQDRNTCGRTSVDRTKNLFWIHAHVRIGLHRNPKMIISAHADYRRQDFMFARTQSPAQRDLPWENPIKPLQSWDHVVYAWTGVAAFALVVLVLLR
jgi:hypothetical protein